MNRSIGSAGQSALTSRQVSAVLKRRASSSRVRLSVKSLALLTTTARASVPTRMGKTLRPMAWQFSTSASLIGRLALATSVTPSAQKRSKPAPEPMLSTVMLPA